MFTLKVLTNTNPLLVKSENCLCPVFMHVWSWPYLLTVCNKTWMNRIFMLAHNYNERCQERYSYPKWHKGINLAVIMCPENMKQMSALVTKQRSHLQNIFGLVRCEDVDFDLLAIGQVDFQLHLLSGDLLGLLWQNETVMCFKMYYCIFFTVQLSLV